MRHILSAIAACAAITIGGQALAQAPTPAQAPAPAPQSGPPATVPDQMPFDIPYGNSITADRAAEIVKLVVAEATKSPRNWKLAISVVDPHGELVYFYKMDNTQLASVTISHNKARTAARLRRPTQLFSNVMQTPAGGYIATLDSPPPTASPGGFPLVEGGKIIGAVGCSGATGDQDAVACKAGAESVK
jgi:glc operon protein GlcG